MKEIMAKQILMPNKGPSEWFGVRYIFNIYRGCLHDCIYCDSRSERYQIEDFYDIQIKKNAPELLSDVLPRKREKCLIGSGSMSDPYLEVEKDYGLTRRCLEIIKENGFGIHLVTKSLLIERDIDILQDLSQNHASVAVTITTAYDEMSLKVEPGAPPSSNRFKLIRQLTDSGIYTGVLLMPVLPFIQDNKTNVRRIIEMAVDSGARFIFPWFSVTLRDRQRDYFYQKLDELFPGLRKQYEKRFGNSYHCESPQSKNLYEFLHKECETNNIINFMSQLPWVKGKV